MNKLCSICMKPHNGSGVGNGDGLDHRWCYERQHPPRDAETIYQVARGCGYPVLAAEVISEMVGGHMENLIVKEFNLRMRKNWARRCETKQEFVIGSKVKTTPQFAKIFGVEKSGEVCDMNEHTVTFYFGGGKETIARGWLIRK